LCTFLTARVVAGQLLGSQAALESVCDVTHRQSQSPSLKSQRAMPTRGGRGTHLSPTNYNYHLFTVNKPKYAQEFDSKHNVHSDLKNKFRQRPSHPSSFQMLPLCRCRCLCRYLCLWPCDSLRHQELF